VLLRVLQLWALPPSVGGLRRCHVFHNFGPRLPAQEGSGATVCSTAPGPPPMRKGSGTTTRPAALGPASHTEGSGAAACPEALLATDKGLLMLGSQPHVLPRQPRVLPRQLRALPRQTVIMGLQGVRQAVH
jgi:hypothetical protein